MRYKNYKLAQAIYHKITQNLPHHTSLTPCHYITEEAYNIDINYGNHHTLTIKLRLTKQQITILHDPINGGPKTYPLADPQSLTKIQHYLQKQTRNTENQ